MKELKEELKLLGTLTGEESDAKFKEIADRYTRPEDKAEIHAYLESTLDGIESDMQELDESLDRMLLIKKQIREVSEIIPLQYIAKNYFGKSASWLSQRINGNSVRGKIYRLKESEIATLNMAIQDIGKKLGSLTIGQ
ncbi:MAG: DUF5053 domain-containing protein [Bacteroidales bacterium]|nr:DUF5053 domain-containing protein [Bacteroidales bacterium]